MPRVSFPAAPASARKQGEYAVTRIGSSASSRIDLAHEVGERHFGGGDEPAFECCSLYRLSLDLLES